jgi:hypothetical protein
LLSGRVRVASRRQLIAFLGPRSIVIVVEENKDFEQILGGRFDAPYIRKLAAEGAVFERMFAEETACSVTFRIVSS